MSTAEKTKLSGAEPVEPEGFAATPGYAAVVAAEVWRRMKDDGALLNDALIVAAILLAEVANKAPASDEAILKRAARLVAGLRHSDEAHAAPGAAARDFEQTPIAPGDCVQRMGSRATDHDGAPPRSGVGGAGVGGDSNNQPD